ncbi:MFS transporter, partial [Lichenifustis flavocetrariae]|nr:hypothetical protein [Lichenifustis flavocetrariae]
FPHLRISFGRVPFNSSSRTARALMASMNQALGLDAFNFTLAGAREGFGPFLGVYLQHQGFDPARTGFAMSLAGIAATAPLGALIDRITAKRAAVVLAITCIAIGAVLVVASKQLWIVAAGQVSSALPTAAWRLSWPP